MSPQYSIDWWERNNMEPPLIDPVDFLLSRVTWRYAKGKPTYTQSKVFLGDATKITPTLNNKYSNAFNLLFTSPPYYDLTDYHYDQWLRLWALGSTDKPKKISGNWQGRFSCKEKYKNLLNIVFLHSAKLLKKNGTVYVRTDARTFTFESTVEALKNAFPSKKMAIKLAPFDKANQTALYGDKAPKPGEVDIIMN